MTLRQKVLWIPGLTLLALSALVVSVVWTLWMGTLRDLEADALGRTARSLRSAVQEDLAALHATAGDWSEWDDSFEFLAGTRPDFAEVNLQPDSLVNLRVDAVLLVDAAGRLACARWVPPGASAHGEPPAGLLERLRAAAHRGARPGGARGVVSAPPWVVLHASRPVLRSDVSGPSPGSLLVARVLDDRVLSRYSALAGASVSVSSQAPGDSAAEGDWRAVVDADTMEAAVRLSDEAGSPSAILAARVDRRLMREGRAALGYLVAAILVCGVAMATAVVVLLDRQVIRRLRTFGADVERIARPEDLGHRIRLEGADELGTTAAAVNRMLDSLQAAVAERDAADLARRAGEARMQEMEKMEAIGRLAGGIAHDFNNLLVVVLGHAELIEGSTEDPELRRHAAAIRGAAGRAAALTRQLLAFGRRQVVQRQQIAVAGFLSDAAALFERVLAEDVSVHVDAPPDAGWVLMDPAQLTRVLLNLVMNARDAMPRGGTLTLAARRVPGEGPGGGDMVRITVRDEGTGIAPEVLPRIFEPFFTTKGPEKGSGLGLATVYGIVVQAGGTVAADSEVGRGTTIRVDLPADPGPAVQEPGPVEPPPAPAPRARRVLVVDDTDAVRSLVRATLEGAGYAVAEASSGEEALDRFPEGADAPPLLVTDVAMPRMDGRRFAAEMARRVPGLRVLFISGYEEADGSGHPPAFPSAFLAKPFTPAALLRAAEELESPAALRG